MSVVDGETGDRILSLYQGDKLVGKVRIGRVGDLPLVIQLDDGRLFARDSAGAYQFHIPWRGTLEPSDA